MITITRDALLQYLQSNKVEAKLQQETGQVYVVLQISGKEFPLFFRIMEESELLQLLVFMPCQIKTGAQNDLARFLHFLNKDLDIPGFGMDESSGFVFYRYLVPVPKKQIDKRLFDSFLKSFRVLCESLAPAVIAVASGLTTYAEVQRMSKQKGS